MQSFLRWVIVVLGIAVLSGCRNKEKEQRRAELRALMHGTTGDADMLAAIEKARATVPEFLQALRNPAANQKQFMVRVIFPATGTKQQILWVTDLTYNGKLLHGRVDDNTSRPGSGIGPDGKVTVAPEQIADWMYNEDGKAVGGYMLRVLKTKMTPEEWMPFERPFSFKE